jgi:hypothetical protein
MTCTVHRFASSPANPEKKTSMEVAERLAGHYVKVKAVERMLRMGYSYKKQANRGVHRGLSPRGCHT